MPSNPLPTVQPKIEPGWGRELAAAFADPSFAALKAFLLDEKARGETIYPPGPRIFAAFNTTPWDRVRVVLLGQDPYHGPGQAHGLSFSVPDGVPFPPSLLNIFKERQQDLGLPLPRSGDLTPWARQGVLLLNATLTVRAHQAGSHQNQGWETFTDAVVQRLNHHPNRLVFLLWGAYARRKAAGIDPTRHAILEAPHPSPLSAHRGFFGSKPFTQINHQLTQWHAPPIDWSLP